MTDYRKLHDAQSIAWEWGQGVTDAETAIRKLHKLFPIDGAPASGVRAGMLRAAEICKEWEGKLSQGAGYAIRTAREAITRAADQPDQPDQPDTRPGTPLMLTMETLDLWHQIIHDESLERGDRLQRIAARINVIQDSVKRAADQVNAEGQVEPLQLPPLNEVIYHAVRGLELDFGSGESLFQGSIDDDTLDLIWESINTALRCAKVSPSAPPPASEPGTVAVPREPTDAMLDAMKNEHWRVRGNQWCKEDYMEVYRAMLRAAQEGK